MSSGRIGFFFTAPMLALAFSMIVIPVLWELGPWVEGRVWPAISHTEVVEERVTPQGVEVVLSFDKSRSNCTLQNVIWMNGPILLNVEPADNPDRPWKPRRSGSHQSGPLLVRSVASLSGTKAVVLHRCHPFWLTPSQFYP